MYRRIALSIALAVSVLSLSLVSSDSTARAQAQDRPRNPEAANKFTADTGVITLGPNQIIRITVVNRGKADSNVRFRKMEYTQGTCDGGVCSHVVASQTTSAPISLAPGEAGSIDIANTSLGVRGVVLSNSSEVLVTGMIIDTDTGKVVGLIMREDELL